MSRKPYAILFFAISLATTACLFAPQEPENAAATYQTYCGNCHLAPDPANIPAPIWKEHVLPEMAARLGYYYSDYDPLEGLTMEEGAYIMRSGAYPRKPAIDSTSWNAVYEYIMSLAPDSMPADRQRVSRNAELTQFVATPIDKAGPRPAAVTSLSFDSLSKRFAVGNAYGKLRMWPPSPASDLQFSSPLMTYLEDGDTRYVAEAGYMPPSQKPSGTLYRLQDDTIDTLAHLLHRPVHTEVVDLNGDGKEEILICEFGNFTGQISMLSLQGQEYVKQYLLPLPGIIKVEIADMDRDGRQDIVLLASQGNEGIFILYQIGNLSFRPIRVVELPPEYGSSWFELVDYNGDQHLDVVLANGDNADYSVFAKPYHGLRIFINDGTNHFEQAWFYPLYGATRVLARDFDQDGDIDLAGMAFFPDFVHVPEEGFVYLENQDAGRYQFVAQTIPGPPQGRWLIMEAGDPDQDGDTDIMLGSFLLPMDSQYKVMDYSHMQNIEMLLLENTLVR